MPGEAGCRVRRTLSSKPHARYESDGKQECHDYALRHTQRGSGLHTDNVRCRTHDDRENAEHHHEREKECRHGSQLAARAAHHCAHEEGEQHTGDDAEGEEDHRAGGARDEIEAEDAARPIAEEHDAERVEGACGKSLPQPEGDQGAGSRRRRDDACPRTCSWIDS